MARILGLFPSALIAARENMSANAFYREIRSLGEGARRGEVLQLYRLAKSIVVRSPDEIFRDIRQTPTASEIEPWPTRKATGILQTVTLAYRQRTTGQISQTWWSIKTDEPIERERAIAMAIDAYSVHSDAYDQDIIGALHTSTRQLMPFSEE